MIYAQSTESPCCAKKPTAACFTDGKKTKVASYQRVAQNLNQLKGALAAGFPVVIGFTVYDSFESDEVAKTGVMPMPAPAEHVLGGHAVLVVGYDDASQRFRVRNSWGTSWGQKGYFTRASLGTVSRTLKNASTGTTSPSTRSGGTGSRCTRDTSCSTCRPCTTSKS